MKSARTVHGDIPLRAFPSSKNEAITPIVSLVALALAISPVLLTPLVSDDAMNYSAHWLTGADLLRSIHEQIRDWVLSTGRIFFLMVYLKDFVFHSFETVEAYKLYLLAMNLATACAFFVYVRLLVRSAAAAAMSVLALCVLLQFRDFHDPVVSFFGLFQISAALMFAILGCHVRYVRSAQWKWSALCASIFTVSLFLYEMAAVAVPLIWLQQRSLRRPGSGKEHTATVLLFILAAYLAAVFTGRAIGATYFGMPRSSYSFGFKPLAAASTFATQLVALVPFSFDVLRPNEGNWGVHALPDPHPWTRSWFFFACLPVFALAFTKALLALRDDAVRQARDESAGMHDDDAGIRAIAWVGAGLILFPAAVIASIARFQGTFDWGNGYTCVYLQGFGLAVLVMLLVRALVRKTFLLRFHAAIGASSIVFGILAAGNLVDNVAVAAKLRSAWGGREVWMATIRSAEFRQSCRSRPLIVTTGHPWTHVRVITRAGFRFADVGRPQAQDVCVLRDVTVLQRAAVAFAAAPPANSRGGVEIRIVVPLLRNESLPEVVLGRDCGLQLRAPEISKWTTADGDFAMFVLDGASSEESIREGKIVMPCERRRGADGSNG